MKRKNNDYYVKERVIRVNGTVDENKVWNTMFSELVASMRPRPETDYTKTVGCSRCGKVYNEPSKPPALQTCHCPGGANAGVRLKGREEMLWWAEVWAAQGYNDVAETARQIANKLPVNNPHGQ